MTRKRNFTPPQKATLHDVAAKVGVSPRTVSRVVNKEGGFSEATEARVMEAITELGYRPNLLARGLITNRTNTLAFIVPNIDDPFFPEVAQGVQRASLNRGLSMFLAVTNGDPAVERELLDRMISQAIDGAILFPTPGAREHLKDLAEQGLPMVVIDDVVDHPSIACLRSDLEHGVELAVEHLRSTGRRTLGMIANRSSPPRSRRRERTFRSLEGEAAHVIRADATYDGGHRATVQMLRDHPEIDGIFAYNDLTAIGAMDAARSAGRRIPEDLAVVGCDDIAMSARVSPGLSTIRIDRERLGTEAVDLLARVGPGEGERPAEPLTLPVELIVRQSS
ncbi:MAG: LacI family DNA-binding transcriptional regulator [Actinomycetota bacterium]